MEAAAYMHTYDYVHESKLEHVKGTMKKFDASEFSLLLEEASSIEI